MFRRFDQNLFQSLHGKVRNRRAIDSFYFHVDIIQLESIECFTSAMEYISIREVVKASILFSRNVQRLDDERPVFVVASIVIGSAHWRAESQKRANATIRRLFTRSTLPDATCRFTVFRLLLYRHHFPAIVQCGPFARKTCTPNK